MASTQLEDLTKNNNQPTDNDVLGVKELLSAPFIQLETINAEIKRLETKRANIEKNMKPYSYILAPIRRVPSDVLLTIFEHCLPTHRNPTMAATEAPMLLTRVCSSWRSIAMASPCLWAQIHIPYRTAVKADSLAWGDLIVPFETITDVLELRCHAAQEWLSRSGNHPLSISISYVDITNDMRARKTKADRQP